MGQRGPARTPTRILKSKGSWRAKSREAAEPRFADGVGSCPAWLSKEARAEWSRQVKQLKRVGLVQQTDRAVLVAYCEAWGEFVQLRLDVDAIRQLATGPKDDAAAVALAASNESLLKLVRLKNAAADRLVKLAAQFGFSPAARARVKCPPAADQADPFEAFLRGEGSDN